MARRLSIILAAVTVGTLVRAEDRIGDAWTDARNPIRQLFNGTRLDLWSLRPIGDPAPPSVVDVSRVRGDIDRFILARLEAEKLTLAPPADPRALTRRLFFDLTGLPPTPEDDHAADSPEAVEKLVDRLLSSPAFGEHWARLWLDVVRYSDSNGYDWDEFRPQAWRFRDYVIRSLNADKPFDRFITEQLAGDEMVHGAPRDSGEQDCLIATGYLRIGPWDNSSKLFGEEHKTRAQWMADLTETTASAMLGMTFTCCRCHDHKTDPLSQADHYRLRAFFAGTEFADDLPLDLAPDQEAIRSQNSRTDAELAEANAKVKQALAPAAERVRAAKNLSPKDEPKDKDVRAALTEPEKTAVADAEKTVKAVEKRRRAFTTALLAREKKGAPAETRILSAGDPDQPRETVEAGIPAIFNPQPLPSVSDGESSGRRTALARWLTAPENPLTARVIANRVWQQLFGQGLVASANDFGFSGTRPTHPELLDHLATSLRRDGWSLKKLVRRIVLSGAYQQAAYVTDEPARTRAESVDGGNAWLWRQNPRRLTAEALRDAILAVSGQLRPSNGGPPAWPELPPEVLQANPAFLDDNAEKTKGWYPSPPEQTLVRSIHLVQKRSVRVPMMESFDLPENFASCARRNVSTVAPQAFVLLNNSFSVTAARCFAERIVREAGPATADRIDRAFTIALGRTPNDAERRLLTELADRHSLAEACRTILNLNEFIFVE